MRPAQVTRMPRKCIWEAGSFINSRLQIKTKKRIRNGLNYAKTPVPPWKNTKKHRFFIAMMKRKKQKVRLTETEAKEAFMQAEKDVSYWCNPPVSETEQ